MTLLSTSELTASSDLDILDDDHRQILDMAIKNILSTEAAELAYAQILDGLPTEDSLWDGFDFVEDHPVQTIDHDEICPGFIENARESRAQFELGRLNFELKTLKFFQGEPVGSHRFNLRLVELVVIACHQIGAYTYELDQGAHKHEIYQEWRDEMLREEQLGVESRRLYEPPPTAFCHRAYRYPEQYPRGLADVAGYWAESKIFGGVVVFDRGETEDECKSMWIHGDLIRGPKTLYPPTTEQFNALVDFLTTPPGSNSECPLPIHGTRINRPRWHPYDAFAYHHIFRDRFERKLPPEPPRQGCVQSGMDWTELDDKRILLLAGHYNSDGEPYVNEDEYAAAMERIRNVTPSSPVWRLVSNKNS